MELETTRIFVKVAQQGSFSKAARLLKLPVSTVSRAVKRLEAEIGATLLQRTTRAVRLTPGGKAFFESAVGPIQSLEDARRSLQGADSIVSGSVKLTAPDDLGAYAVTPALAGLLRKHPALNLEFNYTDEVVDLVEGGYDLAVRVGRLTASRFKAVKVGEVALIAVASPGYLAERPRVRTARDFERHELLTFSDDLGQLRKSPRAFGNQMEALVAMSVRGAGIAIVPQFTCQADLERGRLVRVLPDWAMSRLPVSLIMVAEAQMPARVRVVADELIVSLRQALR